jgi:hypothetical protein
MASYRLWNSNALRMASLRLEELSSEPSFLFSTTCRTYLTALSSSVVSGSTTPRIIARHIDYVSPYRQTTVNDTAAILFENMRPVYSMYREAKNAGSDFYRFLCYYKILDGLLNKMRVDTYKEAKARGLDIRASRQVVPDHPELPDHMRSFAATPMKHFFDNVLTPQFRNAVAHFVTADGTIFDMSGPDHLNSYAGVILVSELCVCAAIAAHEALLQQVL